MNDKPSFAERFLPCFFGVLLALICWTLLMVTTNRHINGAVFLF